MPFKFCCDYKNNKFHQNFGSHTQIKVFQFIYQMQTIESTKSNYFSRNVIINIDWNCNAPDWWAYFCQRYRALSKTRTTWSDVCFCRLTARYHVFFIFSPRQLFGNEPKTKFYTTYSSVICIVPFFLWSKDDFLIYVLTLFRLVRNMELCFFYFYCTV